MNYFFAAWSALDWLTVNRLEKLFTKYRSLEEAWISMQKDEFILFGESKERAEELQKKKKIIIPTQEVEKLQKLNIDLLYIQDADYPSLLKYIPQAPVFLYVKGNIKILQTPSLAIVGTRLPSSYGRQVTENFTKELGKQLVIVSGLAYGIDSIAHSVCIREQYKTIAVLGNGLDSIYPQEHYELAKNIIETGGSILSEFPLGTPANNFNFPRRNRIIAGLSLGTLIVEGKKKSGSIITAKLALEFNREVFAIPGNIFSHLSEAPLQLIQKGEAKLVSCVEDIFEELPIKNQSSQIQLNLSFENEEEINIFKSLSFEGTSIERIVEQTKLPFQQILASLTILEMKGLIKNIGAGIWTRVQ